MGHQVGGDLLVFLGGQIPQGGVLQLPFYLLHTKAVGQGRVDVHGLLALDDLLGGGLVLHGAHIVEPVGDFDEHHPDILAHGHEHLAQVLHLGLLGGGEVGPGQLGDALHQLGNGGAEELFDLLVGGVGVFDAVVEQGAQDGVHIQPHFHHDLGHGQGVNDVGGAVLALLLAVLVVGIVDGFIDEVHVGGGHSAGNGGTHGVIVFFKGFHRYFNSLSAWEGSQLV